MSQPTIPGAGPYHPTAVHPPVSPTRPPGRPPAPVKTGARPTVIVWGAVIALVGVWIILASMGVVFSTELALIVVLGAAGLALVVSALIAAARRPKG
jgi:hypothetical protein